MAGIVVPFRGTGGKQRLTGLGEEPHRAIVLAMLADVLAAATEVGRTVVVTADEDGRRVALEAGAEVVDDPGGGQGAAVAAAIGLFPSDAVLVVNADVPCVVPYDLRSLIAATPLDGIALVASEDGRTNALSLPAPQLFEPLYGARSAERFERAARDLGLDVVVAAIPNLADDVDTREDLDRVLYALAGIADQDRGWGRAEETWNALATVETLGGEDWFRLGDRDLGLHLVRTQALRAGEALSAVTARLTAALGLDSTILPATDDPVRTWLDTPNGSFDFQRWFVARGHRDPVDRVRFEGATDARPAPGVLEALHEADLILVAPSNPFVSVGPILAVERRS